MSDIPEFHGNPNDLDWNPEYVFRLKDKIAELENVVEAAKAIMENGKTGNYFRLQEALAELGESE